jgi:hypothetical protein
MADLNEEQLKRAEARGRKMLETEPRAAAAHYDAATGRVVVEDCPSKPDRTGLGLAILDSRIDVPLSNDSLGGLLSVNSGSGCNASARALSLERLASSRVRPAKNSGD